MARQSLVHLNVAAPEIQHQVERYKHTLLSPYFKNQSSYKILSQLKTAEDEFDLQWISISNTSKYLEKSLAELKIREKTGASVVAFIRGDSLTSNPSPSAILAAGDMVAIIGKEKERQLFQALA